MGKNKKKNNNNDNNNNNANNKANNNNNNNNNEEQVDQEENKNDTGAEAGAGENANGSHVNNKDNSKDNNKDNNKDNKQNAGVIVLGVYLHCQGCVETVVKSLRGFEGVEVVEPNTKDHRLTVKGKNCDPVRIAARVTHKSGKHVEIISPVQKKQPEKKAGDKKKPEAPKVIETVLKMYLHCEGCAKDVKHCILKMHGVQSVNCDMSASHVTVKGSFDPKDLISYISKKAGRHTEVVNPKGKKGQNQNQNEGEQKDQEKNKDKDSKDISLSYPNVPPGLIYAPQLFSDENPNACSIM